MPEQSLRIVLIDDDEDYFVIVRDLLADAQNLRAELTWVDSYEKGLAATNGNHTDVFLVDYRLGEKTGLDLLRETTNRNLRAPVILLTGQGDQEIAVEAMKAGAADYLIKGQIDPALLERSIRHAVDRKRVEAELRESEERFRQLADNIDQVFWMMDANLNALYYSPAFFRIWGVPPEQGAVDRGLWLNSVHPEDLPRRAEMIDKMRTGPAEIEYRIHRPNGDCRWIRDRGFAIRNSQGEIIRYAGIAEDFTDRKLAEESQARLAAAIEQSAEVIVVTDEKGVIQYLNPAFERVTGYTREEALGRTPRLLKGGKQGPEFYRAVWQALVAGQVWSGQMTNRRKDGSLYETEITITPVFDSNRKIINYVAVSRDVTYQRSIEEQLRQSQKMQAIGRLAGGVAHDFNNILTVITGYSDLLTQKTEPTDARSREIQEIRKSAERAAALTRQLLAFSRKQLLNPRVLDVNNVVIGIEKMLRRLIGENIELRTILAPHTGFIKADLSQIEQVIMNLAVNARDAMPHGGKLIVEASPITLEELRHQAPGTYFSPGKYVRICVSDNGVGMTDEVKRHLFEPFFTTKAMGQGTGLGLATCYGIIKQSGGHIIVYSELGHGTVVKVYLPADESHVVAEWPTDAHGEAMVTGKGTILVVEDEDPLRELCTLVLQECGYRVLTACHGEDGLEVARANLQSLDLIITDVIMPRLGGKEMIQRLKPLPARTKVIFVSGYTNDALAEHGVLDPTIKFLEKPFSPAQLSHRISEVLCAKELVSP